MNSQFRKPLAGTALDYFDAEAAVNALVPGAWATFTFPARRVYCRELGSSC
ncbi:MAG: hypothetical protein U5L01_11985 [Rheinheimera sp.]|nr:hypothetical protein [Rheinheimera sp.]